MADVAAANGIKLFASAFRTHEALRKTLTKQFFPTGRFCVIPHTKFFKADCRRPSGTGALSPPLLPFQPVKISPFSWPWPFSASPFPSLPWAPSSWEPPCPLPLWAGGPSASAVPSPFPPSALGLPLSSPWRPPLREKREPLYRFFRCGGFGRFLLLPRSGGAARLGLRRIFVRTVCASQVFRFFIGHSQYLLLGFLA